MLSSPLYILVLSYICRLRIAASSFSPLVSSRCIPQIPKLITDGKAIERIITEMTGRAIRVFFSFRDREIQRPHSEIPVFSPLRRVYNSRTHTHTCPHRRRTQPCVFSSRAAFLRSVLSFRLVATGAFSSAPSRAPPHRAVDALRARIYRVSFRSAGIGRTCKSRENFLRMYLSKVKISMREELNIVSYSLRLVSFFFHGRLFHRFI